MYEISVSSCQELNDAVCGPFNREGLLCTKCKPGYGPPMHSTNLKCEKCHDDKHLVATLSPARTCSADNFLHYI